MAYISGKYTSATEYSITLGGMAIGTVYAILVQDLNSDGSSNGFVCKWKSGATSSTYTDDYTTSATYSRYDRKIGFFQGSFNTDVGRRITDDQFNSWADGKAVIKAWGGGGGGPTPTYQTYAINLRTGTGVTSYQVSYTNSQGNTVTATVSNDAASTVCWVKANSNLTITSVNYATNYAAPYTQQEYNSDFSRVIGTASGDTIYASGTRNFKIKGTYVEPTYKAYFRCHSTVNNFSVSRNGEYVSMNSSTSWSPVDLTESKKQITIKNISAQDNYGAPYYVGFYASSSATSPGSQLQSSAGEFTFEYTANRQYSEVKASKIKVPISLFYWDNDKGNSDGNLIATGKPFSNLTAEMWNRLNKKIKEISEAQKISYTYTTVNSGNTMTATLFNEARNGIAKLPGRGSIPSEKTKGDTAMAGHFNGVNSIKNGLNTAIQSYNA